MEATNVGIQSVGTATTGWGSGGDMLLVLAQADQPAAGPGPAVTEQAPGAPGAAPDPGLIGGTSTGAPATGVGAPASGFGSLPILVVGMLLVIMLSTVFGGRKEKKRRAELLSSLKRQDRVQTTGGIIGTIVELKDDEVVLRVDEGTNTRIRFSRSAIQNVIRESSVKDGLKDGPQIESKTAEKIAV